MDPLEETNPEMEREVAALGELGLLTPSDLAGIPAPDIANLAAAASLLAESAPPVTPEPSVKSRLMSRVTDWEALKPLADVRSYDGKWVYGGAPGVEIRKLFRDRATGRTTMLLRMDPGVRFPSHYHHDDEQCFVISGDIRWGDAVYQGGDFVVFSKSTTHPEIHSVSGNLLLLVAGHNEFVQA
jgi:anti-sigma factor ChrR (cupin superfamily)